MDIISNNRVETNVAEVEFNFNAEEFETALQDAFLKKRKNITVPGFRKGKATRRMIETHYGENVFYEDAVNGIYKNRISDVIDTLGFEIVDAPEIEVTAVGREEGVTFKGKFVVKPDVSVTDYLGLKAEISAKTVTEEDIDAAIEKIRSDNARIIDVTDRAVKQGDTVRLDFAGYCGGEAFGGGTAKDYSLEIGSGRFIPGFEEQIIGHVAGEDFDVNVTFPDDYNAPDLAGKDAVFNCKISEISAKELAELDDEFVKDISEFDTIGDLREDTRKNLEAEKEKEKDIEIEKEIADLIVTKLDAEIPEVMYENRIDDMVRDWQYKYGMDMNAYIKYNDISMEEFRKNFRETAEKQVKFRLALEKIAELENIEVSDEELEEEYKKMAEQYKINIEKIKKQATKEAVIEDIKTERALKLIKDNANITEKA